MALKNELWVKIVTGFADPNPANRYVEFTFKPEGNDLAKEKKVRIPFDVLQKWPMNNSTVTFVEGRTNASPEELQLLLEDLREEAVDRP